MSVTQVCTVPANTLKGLLKAAAKNDVCYYLNGIYFEPAKGRMVTTDGNIMFVVKHAFEDATAAPFIVPRESVERIVRSATKTLPGVAVSVTQEGTALRTIRLATATSQELVTEVDGRYPAYERVIPIEPSGEAAQYDPRILARLSEGIILVTGAEKCVTYLHQNGQGAALLTTSNPDLLGVAMPWTSDFPEWSAAALVSLGLKATLAEGLA